MHRQSASSGFTLIELLIVIAIIGILSAVLIPNLLSTRSRAFDVATMTCLKNLSTRQHGFAANSPFEYDQALDPTTLPECENITFSVNTVTPFSFDYEAKHQQGAITYAVRVGTSVVRVP